MIELSAIRIPSSVARALKLVATLSLPLVPLSAVHGQSEDPVLARQLIMQELDDDAEALGMIVAGIQPADKMVEHARNVAKNAKEAYESFKQNAPGGSAKPEIWTNWADYSKRMEAFVAKSEEMAKLAEAGNKNGVIEIMVDAMPCKACHDTYRTKKSG